MNRWLRRSLREAGPIRILIGLQLSLLLVSVTACQTMGSDVTRGANLSVPVACLAFQPIRWSSKDTLETQKQARGHNAVGVSLCGWSPQ